MQEERGRGLPRFPEWLLFFSYTLERRTVLLDIHEAAGIGVSLDPLLCLGIVGLRAFPHHSVTMSIALRGIRCHSFHLLSQRSNHCALKRFRDDSGSDLLDYIQGHGKCLIFDQTFCLVPYGILTNLVKEIMAFPCQAADSK